GRPVVGPVSGVEVHPQVRALLLRPRGEVGLAVHLHLPEDLRAVRIAESDRAAALRLPGGAGDPIAALRHAVAEAVRRLARRQTPLQAQLVGDRPPEAGVLAVARQRLVETS